MLNILVLLAGQNSFFSKEEFIFPRPLIEINGKSMIQHVIENLSTIHGPKRFIFVVNDEDCHKYHLDNVLQLLTDKNTSLIRIACDTYGALCSALLAIDNIDNGDPLVIANADQIIDADLNEILSHFKESKADAAVATFETVHPRWSYVRFDQQRSIVEAAEKRPISKHAIAGFYYFSKGQAFILAAMESIKKGAHVNGVYYISMVLNELILKQAHLVAYHLDPQCYHTFYSPQKIEEFQKKMKNNPAPAKKLQVVIPMAGDGSRFTAAGYKEPKPFIDIMGKPMIARVLDNLAIENAHYILIAKKSHLNENKDAIDYLKNNYPVSFIEIEKTTEGAACTLLHARNLIDNDLPLLIANCDQIIDININDFVKDCFQRGLDGSIMIFDDVERNPKWSFAKVDYQGHVSQVKEKEPISNSATVGLYLFKQGRIFVGAAIDMIARNDRVKGEFYTCPVFNYVLQNQKKIGVYEIPFAAMNGIGTPEDLAIYLRKMMITHGAV